MKDFPIPVVAVGPGSQPEEDEELQYLPLPSSMMTFALPVLNEEADPTLLAVACNVVAQLRDQMEATPLGSQTIPVIELQEMDTDVVRLLNQTMGEGEVSISVRGSSAYRIQETVFAGVWRLHEFAADGRLARDSIMACAIPPIVTQWAREDVFLDCTIPEKTPGIMNALSVLTEVVDKARAYKTGEVANVFNLTLLPMSPEDLECLAQTLGVGAVTILSRGYGNCRITSTQLQNVWWVQYFNSMDTLILNTLEVSEVPEVALASQEDYEDSIERLGEWLQVMQEPEKLGV
ncbi:hydrogenase expression/formation protein [Sideroxydans sp. CL21]|jgi:hydrogenase-1 operon protein HyaF|uniref:hydrogenase expression/formation protein n=1 Tax=Sideroxydans sp. CL21 TaxID=2600596 RepID=UPI0012A85F8F|nr:hydrogenase expression/formation protein [Sideroxydans sp. CL21]VVC82682.1 Uptake [NiFe] hydrogenase maturation maturation factor HyaF [Sideroxydans sp. CL21]